LTWRLSFEGRLSRSVSRWLLAAAPFLSRPLTRTARGDFFAATRSLGKANKNAFKLKLVARASLCPHPPKPVTPHARPKKFGVGSRKVSALVKRAANGRRNGQRFQKKAYENTKFN
jgi:hypothetical protein